MKCLVTGGAGFIGSNLVDRLVDDGHDVTVIDDLSTGINENINPKTKFYNIDVSKTNFWDLNTSDQCEVSCGCKIGEFDVVFHLAAKARVQPSIENPKLYHDKNVNGLINVLEFCRKYKVKRLVFSSSSSVYGDAEQVPTTEKCKLNPMSPYALHKLVGEQYCKLYSELYNLDTVSLRYFNVYGERQPTEGAYCLVLGKFLQQRLNGEPMTIRGDGEQRRDFTYVGDVVEANIKAGFNAKLPIFPCKGDVFNIGNGDNRSVNQIADMIGGETVNIDPVIEPRETLAENSEVYRVLGWEPMTDIKKWIKKYKREVKL